MQRFLQLIGLLLWVCCIFIFNLSRKPTKTPILELAQSCGLAQPTVYNHEDLIPNETKQWNRAAIQKTNSNPLNNTDRKYVSPISSLIHGKQYHYRFISFDTIQLPPYVLTDKIPPFKDHFSDVLLITASDASHALVSFQCLYSMLLADPYASLLYIDWNLSPAQRKQLVNHLEQIYSIQKKVHSNGLIGYRQLSGDLPSWMLTLDDMRILLVKDVFEEWQGVVGWIHPEVVLVDKLSQGLATVRRYGAFASCSEANVGDSVCESMLRFVHEQGIVKSTRIHAHLSTPNVLLFDYAVKKSHEVLEVLAKCSWSKECMSPRGCSSQIEAVISLVIFEYGIPTRVSYEKRGQLEDMELQWKEMYHIKV